MLPNSSVSLPYISSGPRDFNTLGDSFFDHYVLFLIVFVRVYLLLLVDSFLDFYVLVVGDLCLLGDIILDLYVLLMGVLVVVSIIVVISVYYFSDWSCKLLTQIHHARAYRKEKDLRFIFI